MKPTKLTTLETFRIDCETEDKFIGAVYPELLDAITLHDQVLQEIKDTYTVTTEAEGNSLYAKVSSLTLVDIAELMTTNSMSGDALRKVVAKVVSLGKPDVDYIKVTFALDNTDKVPVLMVTPDLWNTCC